MGAVQTSKGDADSEGEVPESTKASQRWRRFKGLRKRLPVLLVLVVLIALESCFGVTFFGSAQTCEE